MRPFRKTERKTALQEQEPRSDSRQEAASVLAEDPTTIERHSTQLQRCRRRAEQPAQRQVGPAQDPGGGGRDQYNRAVLAIAADDGHDEASGLEIGDPGQAALEVDLIALQGRGRAQRLEACLLYTSRCV